MQDNIVASVLKERGGSYGSFGENASFTQRNLGRLGDPGIEGYDADVLMETTHMLYHKLARLHVGGEGRGNEDSFVDGPGYCFVGAGHILTRPDDWSPRGGKRALFVKGSRANKAYNLVQAMLPTIFRYKDPRHVAIGLAHLGEKLQELV